MSTLLTLYFKLSIAQCPKIDNEVQDMSKVLYASIVGCLMYAMVCMRLDLTHAGNRVSKFLSNPGQQY